MKYEDFSGTLNRVIFEQSKKKLLETIANSPQRYVGLFRPTKPRAKVVQNLLQSHEIRMGDALEEIVEGYLKDNRFALLPKSIMVDGERKELDLHFSQNGVFFFAEMKVRDDHDSTKKKGQITDFCAKIKALAEMHGEANLRALLFFVDPGQKKNRKFYVERLEAIHANSGVPADLCYGGDFFDKLIPGAEIWVEMESHLRQWRDEIPEFPEVNFDKDAAASAKELEEFAQENTTGLRKIFGNEDLRRAILPILFPNGTALRMLREHIQNLAVRQLVDEYLATRGN